MTDVPNASGRFRRTVRIESADGRVWGAGVLLDADVVLTCAHVVSGAAGRGTRAEDRPTTSVVVCPGRPYDGSAREAYVPDDRMWVPDGGQESAGDIALLRLTEPVPDVSRLAVRRADPDYAMTVRAIGFPEGDVLGMSARARIAGETVMGDEWWQLEPVGPGARIAPGFSGGPVVGLESDQFLGIVVARFLQSGMDATQTVAYMIPVETLIRYCPQFASWVEGPRRFDESFIVDPDRLRTGSPSAAGVADRFNLLGPGEVMLVEGEEHDDLATLLTVSDPERSADVDRVRRSRPDIPRLRPVGCAIGCEQRSVGDVVDRILDRTGVDLRDAANPVRNRIGVERPSALVLLDTDRAEDPAALVEEVLLPLIIRSGALCLRIVVGTRERGSDVAAAIHRIVDRYAAASVERLDEIGRRLGGLSDRELGLRRSHRRFEPEGPDEDSVHLWVALDMLRKETDPPDPAELGGLECAVSRLDSEVRRLQPVVDDHLRREADLRARLRLARDRALPLSSSERHALDEVYEQANETLDSEVVDLDAAEELILRYEDGIRRHEHGEGGEPR